MFADQYRNKRVLITGHTGFKGTWLTSWLLELGAEVTGFSLGLPTEPSAFAELGLAKRITHIEGDIRDAGLVARVAAEQKPHIVFHMAAQALVSVSYADPVETFSTNAMGTLHVLEAVRRAPETQALVCITSDKCYRNDEWVWGYRETDALGGHDPYSASKSCAEIIAHSYFRSFLAGGGVRAATVRAGNVIGGGDWALDRLVPDCAKAFAAGRAVSIRSPWATRPWQHVLEPLSGYLWLGARLLQNKPGPLPLNGEAFNFGPAADVNATVGEVADALARHWPGFTVDMDRDGMPGVKECTLLKLCCDKALAHLGWKATLPFDETVRFTAEWYRAFYAGKGLPAGGQNPAPRDMYAFTAGQIAEYSARAAEKGLPWTR